MFVAFMCIYRLFLCCVLCAGASGTEEFIHSVFAVLEAIAQHPNILDEYHALFVEKVLPPLAALIASSNSKS